MDRWLTATSAPRASIAGRAGGLHAGVEGELPARAKAAKGERLQGVEQGGLPPALSPVLHQVWETAQVRGYNEVLSRELQPKVDLLQVVEANWMDSDGSAEGEAGGSGSAGCPTAWLQGTST